MKTFASSSLILPWPWLITLCLAPVLGLLMHPGQSPGQGSEEMTIVTTPPSWPQWPGAEITLLEQRPAHQIWHLEVHDTDLFFKTTQNISKEKLVQDGPQTFRVLKSQASPQWTGFQFEHCLQSPPQPWPDQESWTSALPLSTIQSEVLKRWRTRGFQPTTDVTSHPDPQSPPLILAGESHSAIIQYEAMDHRQTRIRISVLPFLFSSSSSSTHSQGATRP